MPSDPAAGGKLPVMRTLRRVDPFASRFAALVPDAVPWPSSSVPSIFGAWLADNLQVSRPDYILDIKGLPRSAGNGHRQGAMTQAPADSALRGRPWLAIHWKCCHTYSRIYRNAAGTAYAGRCPMCGKALRVMVGEGGTDARFFEAR